MWSRVEPFKEKLMHASSLDTIQMLVYSKCITFSQIICFGPLVIPRSSDSLKLKQTNLLCRDEIVKIYCRKSLDSCCYISTLPSSKHQMTKWTTALFLVRTRFFFRTKFISNSHPTPRLVFKTHMCSCTDGCIPKKQIHPKTYTVT